MSVASTAPKLIRAHSRHSHALIQCDHAGRSSQLKPSYPRRAQNLTIAASTSFPSNSTDVAHIQHVFINALVQASSCRRNKGRWPPASHPIYGNKRVSWIQPALSYNRLPLLVREDIEAIGIPLSKKLLNEIVDQYDDYERVQEPKTDSGSFKGDSTSEFLDDLVLLSQRAQFMKTLDNDDLQRLDHLHRKIRKTHNAIVRARELGREEQYFDMIIENLFQRYKALQNTKLLHPMERLDFLEILYFAAPKKSVEATFRFLSVLDDMRNDRMKIPRSFFHTAMHLAGRTFGRVTPTEVESAIRQWTGMEALTDGNIVTFNILLDVAVKGQQFALAEMMLTEMRKRDLKPDRFTFVGMIYYHGVRGDGDAIRATYKRLVEEDMIVDITVLNCVVASLLRAGEVDAAHHVYQRMRDISIGSRTFALQEPDPALRLPNPKVIGRRKRNIYSLLNTTDPKLIQKLQQKQDLSPDAKTFIILISHHVSETGDLEKIIYYLNEMQMLRVAPHGRIFMDLFRGFWNHGGVRFTLWNKSLLDGIWQAFLDIADKSQNIDVYWDKWLVIWLLRAYIQCYDREAADEKWSVIKSKWHQGVEYEQLMQNIMSDAVKGRLKQRLLEKRK